MADVEKILNEMTLDEKIAQMTSLWVINYVDNGKIDLTAMKRDMKDGIGEISRIAGTVDLEPFEIAQMVNEIQRFLVEETRLGIPAL
ncbi:MAG: beta-glucosidase, partial [Thermotogae bacterium]|nr:beta-glucosidase [Thermotogota bacterium]